MAEERYNVVFDGQIADGFTEETVRHELALSLKLSAQKIDGLFSSSSSVLKKNIDFKTAEQYRTVLEKTGILCKIISITNQPKYNPEQDLAQLSLENSASSNDAFVCPNCGFEQPEHAECSKCGIIFAKYRKIELDRQATGPIPGQTPSSRESGQNEISSQAARRRYLFPFGAIVLAAALIGGYVFWGHLRSPEAAVRYNPERLKTVRNNRIKAHSDLMLQLRALEARGQLDIVYGKCDVPGPAALVALLNDSENDHVDAIAPCIIRYPDVAVITPLLHWYAALDMAEQRSLEEDLKTLFLRIGEPAVAPLVAAMNALEDPNALKTILKSLTLINSKAAATALAQVLETGPGEIRTAGATIIETVISSRHLAADRAFALAVSLSRSPDPDIRRRIADCLDIFEGESVHMMAMAGCSDDNYRVKTAYEHLRARLEQKDSPAPPPPKAVAKKNEASSKEAPRKEAVDTEGKESIWDYTSAQLYCRQQGEDAGFLPKSTELTVKQFFKKLEKAGLAPQNTRSMVIKAKGKNATLTLHFLKNEFGEIVIEKITQPDNLPKNTLIKVRNRRDIILDPCLFINILE